MNKHIFGITSVIVVSLVIVWFVVEYYPMQIAGQADSVNTGALAEAWQGIIERGEESQDIEPEESDDIVIPIAVENTDEVIEVGGVQVTNGTKHSVPLDSILSGGPPQDGIPSIDDPQFYSIKDAQDDVSDDELGVMIDIRGSARFYPFNILVWHEIVNDTVGGQRILVTYCPLCLSGIVFDPVVGRERVEFGTSGKLWNSNLVMYDRKTGSLWSQVLGEAIVGDMTGASLDVLTSDMVRFSDFKKVHPDGEVLTRKTGSFRLYGFDPYGDYYTTPGTYFPVDATDDRLEQKDFVLGVVVNGKAKAYYPPAIKKKGEAEDTFEGKTFVLRYEKEIDSVRMFEKTDGTLERVNPFGNFWFSWVAAHPETELYE